MPDTDLLALRDRLAGEIAAGAEPRAMQSQVVAAVLQAFHQIDQMSAPGIIGRFEDWTPIRVALPVSGRAANIYTTAAIYWGALSGDRVHVVSLDRTSAERRAQQIGPVLQLLGFRHAVRADNDRVARQAAYLPEVTFGAYRDFMQDYLLDRFANNADEIVQGPRDLAVIDDLDVVLLDLADTLVVIASTEGSKPVVVGRISVRDFFDSYRYLTGTSIAAELAAEELSDVYGITVVRPTKDSEPPRQDSPDLAFHTSSERREAAVKEVSRRHSTGQPVVVKTLRNELPSVVSSLTGSGLTHSVLAERDSAGSVMSQAGRTGAITLLVEDTGRGHPVILDDAARNAGGLAVISLGRGPSARVDKWLRALTVDDADDAVGECQFLVSADDFPESRVGRRNRPKLRPWSNRSVLAADRVAAAATAAEQAFDLAERDRRQRQHEVDVIETRQCAEVWKERERVLHDDGVPAIVMGAIESTLARIVASNQDPEELLRELRELYSCRVGSSDLATAPDRSALLLADVRQAYQDREQTLGTASFNKLQQQALLRVIDIQWRRHLQHLDAARARIDAVTNHSQVEAYHSTAEARFTEMRQRTARDVMGYVFQAVVGKSSSA
ncbi:MAG TPA: hypothetical protein VLL08_24725 [Kineosporiaceae bacterium]|nr:hypothetical protein [Kineosporiaceae bacterium]